MRTALLVSACILFLAVQCLGERYKTKLEAELHTTGRTVQFGPENVTQHIGYIDVNGTFGSYPLLSMIQLS